MNKRKLLKGLYIFNLLAIGGWICYYYWNADSLADIQNVPVYIMVLCLIYVLLQITKRMILKENNWWDWLYYIGLTCVMIPTFLATKDNLSVMAFLTDYGTLFLLIPVLFDGRSLVNSTE